MAPVTAVAAPPSAPPWADSRRLARDAAEDAAAAAAGTSHDSPPEEAPAPEAAPEPTPPVEGANAPTDLASAAAPADKAGEEKAADPEKDKAPEPVPFELKETEPVSAVQSWRGSAEPAAGTPPPGTPAPGCCAGGGLARAQRSCLREPRPSAQRSQPAARLRPRHPGDTPDRPGAPTEAAAVLATKRNAASEPARAIARRAEPETPQPASPPPTEA